MTGVDYFAWFVFIVIIVSAAGIFVALAGLPGKLARERQHPQAEAINAAGWLGLLLTLGVVWLLAVVWALTKPGGVPTAETSGENEVLKRRIAELEAQLQDAGGAGQ
jgi:hypothetical protein